MANSLLNYREWQIRSGFDVKLNGELTREIVDEFLNDFGIELLGKAFMSPFNSAGESTGNLGIELIGELFDIEIKTEMDLFKKKTNIENNSHTLDLFKNNLIDEKKSN